MNRKSGGLVMPHKSKIHRRDGDMEHTENMVKRDTTNSKRSKQYRIWRNKRLGD